ncbi:HMA2 domain-containing protein [Gloeothece verrucosa]|uniref:Uncharacterized protein n=1 Tax=Gloeothece verrucosa (strain PCC 7822) TaxID=497965 RepID=E0UGR4_GLOV7|nr:hypothetical protein [Gloeothece verrucosa]ADN14395.1 hypothetical protein Cyan7822_2420 [Gloeothece verrucosa PCC 7822]
MITVEQLSNSTEPFSEIPLWEVIHEIPGRMRVRLLWLQEYPSLHEPVETAIKNLDFVDEVRLSLINNSIIIHYNSDKISPQLFRIKLFKIFASLTPTSWLSAYLENLEKRKLILDNNTDFTAFLTDSWNQNKQQILSGIGTASLVIGGILVPLPLVPGWPLLLLGSYCLKLATEAENSPTTT